MYRFVAMKTLTKKEYYYLYFQTYSVNNPDKRLSFPEIKLLTELILHNEGVSSVKYSNPYYGSGRKKILSELKMETTTFSFLLGKLKKKGFLIKLQQENEYALNIELQKLQNYVNSNTKVHIAYTYMIHD